MRLPILDKLEKELMESERELKVDIPKALKTATDMGDLSENAEYKAAKERQMLLEARISILQKRVSEVTSLNINRIPSDRTGLGSKIDLKNSESGESKSFELVFPEEVSPDEGKISPGSPIGKSLLGKQEGDEVLITIAGESTTYELISLKTIHEVLKESKES
jgi:transcription elongation factor GreA